MRNSAHIVIPHPTRVMGETLVTNKKCLYLIEFNHALKVGISSHPKQRVQQHQKAMETFHLDATVKQLWIGPRCYNATVIEKLVVKEFSPNAREWFMADFQEVLSFIEGQSFREDLTPEEIEREKALDETMKKLMSPPKVAPKDEVIPLWVSTEMLKIQSALTEQAFCLLLNNYLCMGEEAPSDELDMFFAKIGDASFRLEMMKQYQEFAIDTLARNEDSISMNDMASYFMASFLREHGF